jgi:glucan phosphoethanolaminetransferase (alkaline phosphatase superfamily)
MQKAITPVALIAAMLLAVFVLSSVIAGDSGLRQTALDNVTDDPATTVFNLTGLMWVMLAVVPLALAFLMWGLRNR